MLSSLTLTNFALFKKQTIDFKDGFNCLLGQSGAGKSIVIDALSFSLGAKSDKTFIRSGETSLRVDAVFDNLTPEQIAMLGDWEIDFDGELILSRTLSQDGKSSVKMNGLPVTLKMLQNFALSLADFCGQHDSVGLLNVNNHLPLLDRFAGAEVSTLQSEVEKTYDQLKTVESQIKDMGGDDAQRAREKELLEYQIDEIENAHLQLGEVEELKKRFDFISSSEKIFEQVGSVLEKLDSGRENVTSMLYDAKNELSQFSNFDDIEECRQRIENSYYELKDVAETLETIRQNTDFDPKELERIDARLDLIKSLSRKYGKTIEDILNFQEDCQQKLENLENSVEILAKLQSQKQQLESVLKSQCQKLSECRKKYALVFEKSISKELEDLQMQGTAFKVCFEEVAPSKKGFDSVKFMFSANKGQDIRDLHKTASGGELSRLLLAFKNVMLEKERVQTIVFDEIDAGISGHTAGKLAEKLVNISKFTQIICITHTPVVASKANEFLLVEKEIVDENTVSKVSHLDKSSAVVEVARLIDGAADVSQTAINHAKQLFENR